MTQAFSTETRRVHVYCHYGIRPAKPLGWCVGAYFHGGSIYGPSGKVGVSASASGPILVVLLKTRAFSILFKAAVLFWASRKGP